MQLSRYVLCVIALGFIAFAVKPLYALDAHVSVSSFDSPNGPYAEIHLFINGNTVSRQYVDSIKASSSVEVLIFVENNQTNEVVYGDRFRLNGPISERVEDFYDLRRFAIVDGSYSLQYEITDFNDESNSFNGSVPFRVNFSQFGVNFSSVQLLLSAERDKDTQSRFVKNGYRLELAPLNYFPPGQDQMFFYTELYGIETHFDNEEHYALGIDVVRRGTNQTVLSTFRRRNVSDRDVILRALDISEIPSGEYALVLKAVDREQNIIAQRQTLFFRHNPIFDQEMIDDQLVTFETSFVQELENDDLVYSLKAISPVVEQAQVDRLNHILRRADRKEMQYFLFEKWCRIDPINPEVSYEQYMEVARAVDRMFYSGFGHGFETDRGRIFLRYGRPNDMENVQTETDAPPYEIWTYDQLPGTGQTNVQFVFYNPSLAGNMYELLHTNARGELNNPNWIRDLYRNAPAIHQGPTYHHIDGVKDGFNRRAVDIFRDN